MANFLTLSKTSGSNDGNFTLTPSANLFRSARSLTVTVTPNGRKAIVTLKGVGGSTDSLYLSFDATTNAQGYTGGDSGFSITIYSSNNGVAVEPTIGTPSKGWLTADETATVTFTQGGSTVTATITREGTPPFLYIGKTSEVAEAKNVDDLTYSINADDTTALTAYVNSNTDWTVA